jgi:LacI family transcriptional regulator
MPRDPLETTPGRRNAAASRLSQRRAPDAGSHTIRDIARLSGFSRSTVSLVLNGDPRIKPSTRQKVWAVIQKVGYEPNCMARSLARRRSMIAAVVVPKISSHIFSDYYFSESMSGISDTLSAKGYRMIIEMVTENFLRDGMHLRLFRERQIDGMLLVGTLDTDQYVGQVLAGGHTAVLVNSWRPGCSCVVADNLGGAGSVMKHLCALGHRRIGFIGGLNSTTVGLQRDEGYRRGLLECGLPADASLVEYGDFSEQSGYEAARKLLSKKNRPTAVFACNDLMAIGCINCAREMGISVPEGLAVVGADDIALGSYFQPRLTTLHQPMYEIGCLATQVLLDRLAGFGEWPVKKVVLTELVIRDSCGHKRDARRSGVVDKVGAAKR